MNEYLDSSSEHLGSEENDFEIKLRPAAFDDFSGQQKVVDNLQVFVSASNQREDALDHVLLHGPPGLGKTTLAGIIANELGVNVKITSGPVLTAPLRARFGINCRLEYYDSELLSKIVDRSAGILDVPIEYDAAGEIAGRSRGTPRIANALLRRVRDFAQIKGSGNIDMDITNYA